MISLDRIVPVDLLQYVEALKDVDTSSEFSDFEELLHPKIVFAVVPGGISRGIEEVRRDYEPFWLEAKTIFNEIEYQQPSWITLGDNSATFILDYTWRHHQGRESINLNATSLNVVVREHRWQLISCLIQTFPLDKNA